MKTNDQLYDDLIEQALLLLNTHDLGEGNTRTRKLRECVHLMEAYDQGQDIVLAKLSMTDDDLYGQRHTVSTLQKHLGSSFPRRPHRMLPLGPYWFVEWLRNEDKSRHDDDLRVRLVASLKLHSLKLEDCFEAWDRSMEAFERYAAKVKL